MKKRQEIPEKYTLQQKKCFGCHLREYFHEWAKRSDHPDFPGTEDGFAKYILVSRATFGRWTNGRKISSDQVDDICLKLGVDSAEWTNINKRINKQLQARIQDSDYLPRIYNFCLLVVSSVLYIIITFRKRNTTADFTLAVIMIILAFNLINTTPVSIWGQKYKGKQKDGSDSGQKIKLALNIFFIIMTILFVLALVLNIFK